MLPVSLNCPFFIAPFEHLLMRLLGYVFCTFCFIKKQRKEGRNIMLKKKVPKSNWKIVKRCKSDTLTQLDDCWLFWFSLRGDVWLCIVVFNTYCVVFLLCFSSSCVPYVASFSELPIFYCPLGILLRVFKPATFYSGACTIPEKPTVM
jgi:hypothetical protein